MSLKQDISNTYFALVNKTIEGKQLQYWEQAIVNKAATLDSFKAKIMQSDEYVENVYQTFKSVVDETFTEHSLNVKEIFDVFWKANKKSAISRLFCKKYIYEQGFFLDYIRNVVVELYNFEYSMLPSDIDVNMLIRNFTSNLEYTLKDLIQDISNKKIPVANAQVQQPLEMTGGGKKLAFNENIIDDFEDIFSRPMYIQEYFKYQDGSYNWEELLEAHTLKFNTLKSTFVNYTGKSISEYYFVKKYLMKIDNPNFFEDIVIEIVNSNEYRIGVQKVIVEQYKTMYDQSLYASDIEYIFDIIKGKKLDIVSEEIGFILQQFKEETDEIISNIFRIFIEVLQRPPDMSEIEKYVNYYRDRKDSETTTTTNTSVEKNLIHTLEFHDIIKKHIKDIYVQQNEKDVLQSSMYEILQKVLLKIDDINIRTLDDIIYTYI